MDKQVMVNLFDGEISRKLETTLYLLGYQAEKFSYKAYAVGNFVRDLLLGKENFKIELIVEGDLFLFTNTLQHKLPGKFQCYEKLGKAFIRMSNFIKVEITALRNDICYLYTGTEPVCSQTSLKNELYNKDFSINTLALELNPGNFCRLLDFFGGEKDLNEGMIRVLYSLSFIDEPLRLLRALCLEQKYDFKMDRETDKLMRNAIAGNVLHRASKEGVGRELRLILSEPTAYRTLERLHKLGLWRQVFPQFKYKDDIPPRLQHLERLYWRQLEGKCPLRYNVFITNLCGLFYGLSLPDIHCLSNALRLKKDERKFLIKFFQSSIPAIRGRTGLKEEMEQLLVMLEKQRKKEEGVTGENVSF